jgi:ABC-type transport system involved in multi-copper enzyme maturation permease subunit
MNDLAKLGNLEALQELTWELFWSYFRDDYSWFIPGLVGLLLFLFFVNYFTRTGAIARATTKEAIRQPVYLLLLAVGSVIMWANCYIPFFSLGDDTKMFIDCGLATILICSLLVAIWTASLSVAEEIEGKTAMTLLSKPITRREFILGKYFGIAQSTLWMILFFGFQLIGLIFFLKAGIDAKESSATITDVEKLTTALRVLPGMALVFMEVAVMTAISVAISTRMPMLVNVTSCLAVFVIGHLTPVLVKSSLQNVPFVKFVANLLATILPALDNYNMSAAIAMEQKIPMDYIGYNALYSVCYITAIVLLAFILFEDRDLA